LIGFGSTLGGLLGFTTGSSGFFGFVGLVGLGAFGEGIFPPVGKRGLGFGMLGGATLLNGFLLPRPDILFYNIDIYFIEYEFMNI
jgi:hypothetical protein